jgi:hypothetical protein
MSKVEELERAVSQLDREQLAAFRRWFLEFDAELWDRQFEQDAVAGRLDALGDEAVHEHREGRTRPL